MPHASVKITPGVDVTRTPALNEAALSQSQLIRFLPDRGGLGLPQKLGGWDKYFPGQMGSPVRNLWGWTDTNDNDHLAVGAEEALLIIHANGLNDITPHEDTRNPAVAVTSTAGSNQYTIKDVASSITSYDSVFIETQISVGGVVLFGLFQCYQSSDDSYNIFATDQFGNPLNATASVSEGGAVPTFETTVDTSIVEVVLEDHGYVVGDTFPVLVSTTVGGVTLAGNYLVASVIDADTFTIQATHAATSSAGPSGENGGNARYHYYISEGPIIEGSGYGSNAYGEGGYGTGVTVVPNPGTPITATDWSLSNWGQILVATPFGGATYQWDPTTNAPSASVLPNAPTNSFGTFVAMPQRQVVAYGTTFNGIIDPLLVRWSDLGNFNTWIASVTNQAGSYRIPKGSKIVGALQGPQQGLLWTDLSLWTMQYINQPLIWGFNELASGCGLIAQKAAGILNGDVYWMSQSQFFKLSSNGVQVLPCPIWDVIFQNLNQDQLNKIRVAPNSRFNEIAWYYPGAGQSDVTNYVKYNASIGQWDYGTLSRTAWIDQSVLGPPIGAGDEYIYQHETSPDADGQAMNSSFRTGYFALSEGDNLMFVDQFWPDMKWGEYGATPGANVQITFYATDYPGDTPRVHGPYTVTQATQFITPRIRARLVALEVGSSDPGSFWRMGSPRYRFQPDGRF